jgi:hypothetical protein
MDRPKPSKGDRLWFIPEVSSRAPTHVTVIKVGTKYFTTDDERRWTISDWRQPCGFLGRLYANEEEWQAERNLKVEWDQLQKDLQHLPYNPPITLEQIEAIRATLKL